MSSGTGSGELKRGRGGPVQSGTSEYFIRHESPRPQQRRRSQPGMRRPNQQGERVDNSSCRVDNPVDVWTTLRTTAGFLGMTLGGTGDSAWMTSRPVGRTSERTNAAFGGMWDCGQLLPTPSERIPPVLTGVFPLIPISTASTSTTYFSLSMSLFNVRDGNSVWG